MYVMVRHTHVQYNTYSLWDFCIVLSFNKPLVVGVVSSNDLLGLLATKMIRQTLIE